MKKIIYMSLVGAYTEALSNSKKLNFNMLLLSNMELLEGELEKMQKAIKLSDKCKEFDRKRKQLCDEYCKKDIDEMPIMENNVYVGLNENPVFKTKLTALKEEYAAELLEVNNWAKQFNEMLQQESEIELKKIPMSSIVDDLLSGTNLLLLKKYDLLDMEETEDVNKTEEAQK